MSEAVAKERERERKIPTSSDSKELAEPKKKYPLKKGAEKRSLSVFSNIVLNTEPIAKQKRVMEEDTMSGEEIDEFEDALSPMPRPPSNFSSLPVPQPAANGFRSFPSGIQSSKKLEIKGFRIKKKACDDYLNAKWPTLEESVVAIQNKRKVEHSLEQLYKIVEQICEGRQAHELNDRLQLKVRESVANLRMSLSRLKDVSGSEFLRVVESTWSDFCQQMVMIRSIFLYLDRTYILPNATILSIWDASLAIFREEIIDHGYIQKRIVTEILKAIEDERGGAHISSNLIRSLLRMFSNLQVYHQIFENAFLRSTEELFTLEGNLLCRDLETADYLRYVCRRLAEEAQRVDLYLDEMTRKPLIAVTEKCLIVNHSQAILDKGIEQLLLDHRIDDLEMMFGLLNRIKDGLNQLKLAFSSYIKKIGKSMVMDAERDKSMVEDLMSFKDKMDQIVAFCFGSQEKFVQAEKDAFDYFINTRPNKPAELMAKYMDTKLRNANREASDEELDRLMDKVITLFRFIQGKDVFEAFYKKDLAKRLLLGRSASVDAEKAMLCKLKQECGPGFTHKLEGMFKDMEISKDLNAAFHQYCEHEAEQRHGESSALTTDLTVNVLTSGQWPAYDPCEARLPCVLGCGVQLYQDFYVKKHSGRKLQWQHSLGQCTLKATFRPKYEKELVVSLYQGLVLLLFNDKDEWSLSEIEGVTKIDRKSLIQTMLSLALGKSRILLKNPKGKEVSDADSFCVNGEFSDKLHRIRISNIQMKETEEEHKQTEEQVNQDRQYQIDAAIVRIMKTRKQLSHQNLIAELFSQLRFPAKAADLKKRIGSLIEREYLCRDAVDPNTYKYVT